MGCYGFFMSCINVCSAPIRQSRMSAENQGVMHAAFRTATWGVIPLAALVGGAARHRAHPARSACSTRPASTMVGGTLLAAFSFVSAVRVQPLLDQRGAAEKAELAEASA